MQKEQTNTTSSSSSTPVQPSALATKLLSLWSHGLLAAVVVQELAHLAILDGASHPELASIAKCGNFGQQPGNVHRDLMSTFCKDTHVPAALPVAVECKDPKSSELEEINAGVFLPHIMFANLVEHY